MSIDDDVALLERVPTLRLLGRDSLRMLAIGSEQRSIYSGEYLFRQGEEADSGFVVARGAFRVDDGAGAQTTAGPGTLIGELALVVAMQRPVDRDRDGKFDRDPHRAQPVPARAGKRSRRGAAAARRVRRAHQPARERHPDGRREAEHLMLVLATRGAVRAISNHDAPILA